MLGSLDVTYTPPGHPNKYRSRVQRGSSRRHFRHGQRAATLRAFTAARLYLANAVPTLAAAAEGCGSNVAYVRAANVLLKAENASLVSEVVAGRVPLLQAAAQMRRLDDLIAAYRDAEDLDRVAFAKTWGVDKIFDTLVQASV